MGSGITLTSIDKKDIINVTRFLQNRDISLKVTTEEVNSQDRRLLIFFFSLMTASLPLMKNVLITLAKTVLISLEITAAVSAADAVIDKKHWIGMATLIISNEEMDDIIKVVKSFEQLRLLIKCVGKQLKMK